MRSRLIHFLRTFAWSPVICFGLAWALMQTEPMRQIAWRTLDWRTHLRAYFQPPPDPRVGIILFEDGTEMNLVAWPPDRAYHGMLIELLAQTRPAVLTWDVIFDASREGDGDNSMAAGIEAAAALGLRVVSGSVTEAEPVEAAGGPPGPTRPLTQITGDIGKLLGDEHAILPFPQLRAVSTYGFVDAPRGRDGIIRELPLVVRVGQEVYPSLVLQTLMAYWDIPAGAVQVRLGEAIILPTKQGDVRVPITDTGRYFINYRYDHDDIRPDFPTYSYADVLLRLNRRFAEGDRTQAVPDFAGKILLLGQTVTGKADAGPTPRNAYAPLVLLHANAVANILSGDYARRGPDPIIWGVMIALGYLCVWLALRRSITRLALVSILIITAYTSLVLWGWIAWSLWFPWVGPLLGFTALQLVVIGRRVWQEQKAKQEIQGMFGSYVSPQVVERMVNAGEPPQLGGHEAEITAYFSDIQGYSTFSERLSPVRLVELLNDYLTVCTDIVQEEGGTLDKYIGDAVVAMFGAPIAHEDHAYRACVAALRVQHELGALRERWTAQGETWPLTVRQMRTRIGLNTGRAVVGNMGSRTRFNYTMTGDEVNLAARMESGAKHWGAYTLCTEATRAACVQHGGDRVVFRPLGRIVVKGRSQPVGIHEVVGLREHTTDRTFEALAHFASGLERYHQRDWTGALACFQRSESLEPLRPGEAPGVTTNPSLVFQEQVRQALANPPPADWDGVYVMQDK
jgi:adenylate cyclase